MTVMILQSQGSNLFVLWIVAWRYFLRRSWWSSRSIWCIQVIFFAHSIGKACPKSFRFSNIVFHILYIAFEFWLITSLSTALWPLSFVAIFVSSSSVILIGSSSWSLPTFWAMMMKSRWVSLVVMRKRLQWMKYEIICIRITFGF